MTEKTIRGLISRFEEKCAHRDDEQCVFLTVAEMKLVIRTLKHVNWRFQQQVMRKGRYQQCADSLEQSRDTPTCVS